MAIFGRNKEEEIEDVDEFEGDEIQGSKKFTKNFRDLNPKNKKKRKEPPKPWGKKERLIVLIVLLATVIISAILTVRAKGKSEFHLNLPKFDLKSLNLLKEETIIIQKK